MAFLKQLKAIMICEGKSFEQALFYLLRLKYGYSIKELGRRIGLSDKIIKRAEEPKHGYKRLPLSLSKRIISYYNMSLFEYDFLKNEIKNITVSTDTIVLIYQSLFGFSPIKSMLYVHSKINGLSKKEYKKIIRISRLNIAKSGPKINDLYNSLIHSNQSLYF